MTDAMTTAHTRIAAARKRVPAKMKMADGVGSLRSVKTKEYTSQGIGHANIQPFGRITKAVIAGNNSRCVSDRERKAKPDIAQQAKQTTANAKVKSHGNTFMCEVG